MSKVNQEEVLRMFQEGKKTKEIARRFDVSKQAIDQHRQKFVAQGKLPVLKKMAGTENLRRAPRKSKSDGDRPPYELDQGVEALIKMAALAAQVPKLEQDNWTLRNKLAATEFTLKELQKEKQNKEDQARRYQLAVKHGEINPPLTSGGNHLTEHIVYQNQILVPDSSFPYNITLTGRLGYARLHISDCPKWAVLN